VYTFAYHKKRIEDEKVLCNGFVMVPVAGYYTIEVEAENIEDAKEIAFDVDIFDKNSKAELCEFDYFEKLSDGNVLYAPLIEINIQEIED